MNRAEALIDSGQGREFPTVPVVAAGVECIDLPRGTAARHDFDIRYVAVCVGQVSNLSVILRTRVDPLKSDRLKTCPTESSAPACRPILNFMP
jgi:hypothetical protein